MKLGILKVGGLAFALVSASSLWAAPASFHSDLADSDGVISSTAKSAVVNQAKADSTDSYPSLMMVAGGSGPTELFTGSLSSGAKSGASVTFSGALDSTTQSTGASSSEFKPMTSEYVSCTDDGGGYFDFDFSPDFPLSDPNCDWGNAPSTGPATVCNASWLFLTGTNYTSSPPSISASDTNWTDVDPMAVPMITLGSVQGTGVCIAMHAAGGYEPYAYEYVDEWGDVLDWRDNGMASGTPVACCWKDSGGAWHHSNNVTLVSRGTGATSKLVLKH